MAITLNLDYLDWNTGNTGDPHEFDPTDISHDCQYWCIQNELNVRFYIELTEIDIDGEYEVLETSMNVYGEFASEDEAVLFKLTWSEPDYQ